MSTTVLTNQSGGPLEVKEGTGGVWRNLSVLKNNEVYTIHVDPNATYREYWCATKDIGPNKLFISSDDCQECGSVTVKVRENGTHYLDKVSRVVPGKAKDNETVGGTFVKILQWIRSAFHKGSTSTKTTESLVPGSSSKRTGFASDL